MLDNKILAESLKGILNFHFPIIIFVLDKQGTKFVVLFRIFSDFSDAGWRREEAMMRHFLIWMMGFRTIP